ncbi:MAG: hypothetical protein KF773_21850 [Deltaproteobacteria bacterium]|nr:hypothetical protein [Deltaproteobacteria bacterium]MCW5802049.1 hypothetical protein [Deltaproteobacteria bacterium]
MGEEVAEREFMGRRRSRMWTYLILMVVLVVVVVVINLAAKDPHGWSDGIKSFFGLPGWALATITFLAGAITFWFGLKVETDWPEAIGAFLISASVVWMELIVGWNRFELGGLFVLPYLIPIVVFAFLLMYGMKKSV